MQTTSPAQHELTITHGKTMRKQFTINENTTAGLRIQELEFM